MPLTPGDRLGPYEILAPIGAGGMGEVFQARDTRLNRLVAIKTSQARFSERFEREARAVAALNHPNICTLYDVGPDYLVMEFIDGKPLAGPLPLETVIRYAAQIASALDAAHRAGIVHRDLKPANILVTKAGLKLLDFGLAKMNSGGAGPLGETATTATVTEAGSITGTLQYMSPEQLEGKEVDARSDIFAFGCVLYELLSGRMAFAGESKASVIAAILERSPQPVTGVSPAVSQVIERALAKEPDDRWQSARDVARVLELAAHASPAAAAPAPVRRSWFWPAIAAALALALAAAGVVLLTRKPPPEVRWSGAQLGGPAEAFNPAVSPDGSLIAFVALIDGQSQIGVMKPETGNWRQLTHQPGLGEITGLAWSGDGAKIYFDRTSPPAVFSVPVLGGDPRPVLESASLPQVFNDGSLSVVRINARRERQVYRFHVDSGKLDPLPAIAAEGQSTAVRATPDGKHLLVYGNRSNTAGERLEPGLFAMDIDGRNLHPLAPGVVFPSGRFASIAFAGSRDPDFAIVSVPAGALYRVLEIPLDGGPAEHTLFTLSLRVWQLDTAPDGSIVADQVWRGQKLLRMAPTGGAPEQITGVYSQPITPIAVLSDGRPVVQLSLSGAGQVAVVQKDGSTSPLIESGEACGPPATVAGEGKVALMTDKPGEIAVVSVENGRIVERFQVKNGPVDSLAASPDGKLFYYSAKGFIWSVPEGGGEETQLAPGDAVAANPDGKGLVIALAADSSALTLVPAGGGRAQPIPLKIGLRIPATFLASGAVAKDGKIVATIASPSHWFYSAGIVDPRTGSVSTVPVDFDGELVNPLWTRDGKIIADGREYSFSLWRFRAGK